MSENQNSQFSNFENYDQAEGYIDAVRQLYRDRMANYSGRREGNETLEFIDEYAREEANLVIDRVFLGVMGLGSVMQLPNEPEKAQEELKDDETERIGGFSWSDYRDEFANMMAGFAVITHRMERDGLGVPSFTQLSPEDGLKVTEALFSDFQQHNAYRFGVDGTKARMIPEVLEEYDEEWVKHKKPTGKYIDAEKAQHLGEISRNMRVRKYRTGTSQHAAVKVSPAGYVEQRQLHPQIEKDDFDAVMSGYRNPIEVLANRDNDTVMPVHWRSKPK